MVKGNPEDMSYSCKNMQHLWGVLFIPSPDDEEQNWEEGKLQPIISTDFIDLTISDNWSSWMHFDVILNKSAFFFTIIFVVHKKESWTRKSCGVWALIPKAYIQTPCLVACLLMIPITNYSTSHLCPLDIAMQSFIA